MTVKITFLNTNENLSIYPPKPASQVIPDWYKQMNSYLTNKKFPLKDGLTSATIKRCMPVFDAVTAGYIIFTDADISVTEAERGKQYYWSRGLGVNSHPFVQAAGHPRISPQEGALKIVNTWTIQTPKGYSCLFLNPLHREKLPINIYEGVVDTDTYHLPVQFPCQLTDPNFEGIIPAGTPIVQVIPFKRESFEMEITKQNEAYKDKITNKLNLTFFDKYKDRFWSRKEYR